MKQKILNLRPIDMNFKFKLMKRIYLMNFNYTLLKIDTI
jgi:hypothetical protein